MEPVMAWLKMAAFFSLLAVTAQSEVLDVIAIEPVWSGHPVGFCLLTHPPHQFAAYYDADRIMTVAQRTLDSKEWKRAKLPEHVVWDSHNSVTMAVDSEGYIHLSGNMHVVPLIYFRTKEPFDVTTFERSEMVGDREKRCTYPKFISGPGGELIFTYRDGKSGEGDQIFNVYNTAEKRWRRLLDTPLTSGEGDMNAYFHGPVKGPDGRFHLCWVWRDHFGCESNHDLSYARSTDLVHWETSSGKPLALPITLGSADIVDPVPAGGGIINGNTVIGFDSHKRLVIGYHKYDAAGKTQLYNARLEEGGWKIYQTSDWDYRWEFSGGGTINFEIGLSGVQLTPSGELRQSFRHVKYGSKIWILDEESLKPTGTIDPPNPYPENMRKVKSTFPGMRVRHASDSGESGQAGIDYVLRWETLDANRDKPHEGSLPEPSLLELAVLKDTE